MKIKKKNDEIWVYCSCCNNPMPIDLMRLRDGDYFCADCSRNDEEQEELQ